VEYAQRVIQMRDGIIHWFITSRNEMLNLAARGKQESGSHLVQTSQDDSDKTTNHLLGSLMTAPVMAD